MWAKSLRAHSDGEAIVYTTTVYYNSVQGKLNVPGY